jgi:hypothetical protein
VSSQNAAKPATSAGGERASGIEQLGSRLDSTHTPTTANIQDVLGEMIGGDIAVSLWIALMGDAP